jgi:hypothetical protein
MQEAAVDVDDLGPVEFLVVAFPGSRFSGEIVPALLDLVESGIVRIIDLVFVSRDLDGTITALEVAELDDDEAAAFARLGGGQGLLLSDEDLEYAAEALEPGDSAAVLVWEDVWAAGLAKALRNAGAELVALERVPRELVVAAVAAGTEE